MAEFEGLEGLFRSQGPSKFHSELSKMLCVSSARDLLSYIFGLLPLINFSLFSDTMFNKAHHIYILHGLMVFVQFFCVWLQVQSENQKLSGQPRRRMLRWQTFARLFQLWSNARKETWLWEAASVKNMRWEQKWVTFFSNKEKTWKFQGFFKTRTWFSILKLFHFQCAAEGRLWSGWTFVRSTSSSLITITEVPLSKTLNNTMTLLF